MAIAVEGPLASVSTVSVSETVKTKAKVSAFALAVVLFAVINGALVAAQPLAPLNPDRVPARPSWESHRTQDFQATPSAPDVVLLGSSLMMIPTACCDADFLKVTIDPVVHPYSKYLQAKIAEKSGKQLQCFNFALPGGMISDHFMVVSSLVSPERKPKLLIFGLSLRDFIDSGVECAAATPAYHYFSRYKSDREIEAMLPLSMPSLLNRGEYLVDKYIYLFGKRLQMQVLTAYAMQNQAARLLASYPVKKLSEDTSTAASANPDAALTGGEVLKGMVALQPDAFYPWQDNSREYKKRFKGKNDGLFKIQQEYMNKTLSQLQEQGIEVLLVNMPLTEANMKLMPEGSYQKYLQVLAQEAEKYGCALLDLNDQKTFVTANFKDPVHMNGSGGKVLIDRIAAKLGSTPSARSGDPSVTAPASRPSILAAITGNKQIAVSKNLSNQ